MKLKRSLGFWAILFLSINAIIGTGIFFTPAIAASIAGPASLISWILASLISIGVALCIAELVSIFPKAGGVYEFSKKAYGGFFGFLIGWTAWIVANIAIAMLVIGGMDYLSSMIPLNLTIKILLALFFVVIVNYISFKGIDISAKLLLIFAAITLTVVLLFITIGLPAANIQNLKPFYVYPKVTIFAAIFLILETFFGWESVTYLAEETKNPKKTIPIAMILATIVISILAILVAFVSLTVVSWKELASTTAPMALVLEKTIGKKYGMILLSMILINIMGAAAAWIITTPRLIYAMARDKMLPMFLSQVHPKYKTPHSAIILQTLITCFLLISGSFKLLLKVVLPLAIFTYIAVILAVTKLRIDKPNLKRNFKMPMGKILPIVIVTILIVSMLLGSNIKEILLGIVFIFLGIPLYIIAILGYHEKFIKWFSNHLAWLTYKTYNFLVLRYIGPHILNYLSDPTVFTVLDVGCGVGALTHQIAKKAVPLEGKVYGIDFAEKEIAIAKWHKNIRGVKNLEYYVADIYKLDKYKKLKKKLRKLDAVIGVGVLQYLPNIEKALKIIRKHLRKGGRIYFVDYDYIGQLFEKPWIEHDEEIIKMFEKAGFKVKVWRQKRLLWQYVHIYGYKK